jgi:hypothetical protein
MEILKLKIRAILARFRVWWYNLSSKTFEWQIGPILWQMAAIVAGLLVLLGIGGCGTTKVIPVENKEITKVEVRDSIVYRDTTIYIPQEKIVEVTPRLDTLRMEIETAVAKAYLDTDMQLLRGELKSKRATQKNFIERIEIRERTDTVYVERPQPYEVPEPYIPKWCWWSLIINIVGVLLVAFRIYLKFKL